MNKTITPASKAANHKKHQQNQSKQTEEHDNRTRIGKNHETIIAPQQSSREPTRRPNTSRSSSFGRFGRNVFCALVHLVHNTNTAKNDNHNRRSHGKLSKQQKASTTIRSYDELIGKRKLSLISGSASAVAIDSESGRTANDCCLSLITRATTSISPDRHSRKHSSNQCPEVSSSSPTSPSRTNESNKRLNNRQYYKSWLHLNRASPTNSSKSTNRKQIDEDNEYAEGRLIGIGCESTKLNEDPRSLINHQLRSEINGVELLDKSGSLQIDKVPGQCKICNSSDGDTTTCSKQNHQSHRKHERLGSKSSFRDHQQSESVQSGSSSTYNNISQQDDAMMTNSGHSINHLPATSLTSHEINSTSNSTPINMRPTQTSSTNSDTNTVRLNDMATNKPLQSNAPSANNSPIKYSSGPGKQTVPASNFQRGQLSPSTPDRLREMTEILEDIGDRLSARLRHYNDCNYADRDGLFYLENNWAAFVDLKTVANTSTDDTEDTESDQHPELHKQRLTNLMVQQDTIWEFVSTENSYIRCLKQIIDVFLYTLNELQKHNLLTDIDATRLISNIDEVYEANHSFWLHHLYPMLTESRSSRKPLDPSLIHDGFAQLQQIFKPYYRYCMDHSSCLAYLKEQTKINELFKVYVSWCESRMFCDRLRLMDLLAKPTQRITRYSLLLKSILRRSDCKIQANDLKEMIANTDRFVLTVDLGLRHKDELRRLLEIDSLIESHHLYPPNCYNNEEIDSLLQTYNRPVELLAPLFNCDSHCQRQLLFDSSSNQPSSLSSQIFPNSGQHNQATGTGGVASGPSSAAMIGAALMGGSDTYKRLSPKHSDHNSSKQVSCHGQFKFRDASSSNKIDIVLLLFTDQLLICKQVSASSACDTSSSLTSQQKYLHQVQNGQAALNGNAWTKQTCNYYSHTWQPKQHHSSNIRDTFHHCDINNYYIDSQNHHSNSRGHECPHPCNEQLQLRQHSDDGCIIGQSSKSQSLSGVSNLVGGHQSSSPKSAGAVARPRSNSSSQRCFRTENKCEVSEQNQRPYISNQRHQHQLAKQNSSNSGSKSNLTTIGDALETSASRAASCILAPSGCLNFASPILPETQPHSASHETEPASTHIAIQPPDLIELTRNCELCANERILMTMKYNLSKRHNTSMASSTHSSISSINFSGLREHALGPSSIGPNPQQKAPISQVPSLFQRGKNSFKRSSGNQSSATNQGPTNTTTNEGSVFGFHNYAGSWRQQYPGNTNAATRPFRLRLIRSPYPISKLTMIELKDSKSVLFLVRGDDLKSLQSSFVIYLPSSFGAGSSSSNGTSAANGGSSLSDGPIIEQATTGYGIASDNQNKVTTQARSPASILINLLREAQLRFKVAKEFHNLFLESNNHSLQPANTPLSTPTTSIPTQHQPHDDSSTGNHAEIMYTRFNRSGPGGRAASDSGAKIICAGSNPKRWSFSGSDVNSPQLPSAALGSPTRRLHKHQNHSSNNGQHWSARPASFRHQPHCQTIANGRLNNKPAGNTQCFTNCGHEHTNNNINSCWVHNQAQQHHHHQHQYQQDHPGIPQITAANFNKQTTTPKIDGDRLDAGQGSRWSQHLKKSLIELYRGMLLSHAQFDRLLWTEQHCLSMLESLVSRPEDLCNVLIREPSDRFSTAPCCCAPPLMTTIGWASGPMSSTSLYAMLTSNNHGAIDQFVEDTICNQPSACNRANADGHLANISNNISTPSYSSKSGLKCNSMSSFPYAKFLRNTQFHGPFSNRVQANRASFRVTLTSSTENNKCNDDNNKEQTAVKRSKMPPTMANHCSLQESRTIVSGDYEAGLVTRAMSLECAMGRCETQTPLQMIELEQLSRRTEQTRDQPSTSVDSRDSSQELTRTIWPRSRQRLMSNSMSMRIQSQCNLKTDCDDHDEIGDKQAKHVGRTSIIDNSDFKHVHRQRLMVMTGSNNELNLETGRQTLSEQSSPRRSRVSSLRRQNVVYNQSFCRDFQQHRLQTYLGQTNSQVKQKSKLIALDNHGEKEPKQGNVLLIREQNNDIYQSSKQAPCSAHHISSSADFAHSNSSSFELGQLQSNISPAACRKIDRHNPRSSSIETAQRLSRSDASSLISVTLTGPQQKESTQILGEPAPVTSSRSSLSQSARYLDIPTTLGQQVN